MRKQGMFWNPGRRRALLLGAVTIAALSVAGTPRPVTAARAADACAAEWARYNDCLVSASGWFTRKLCDVDFVIDIAACIEREVNG